MIKAGIEAIPNELLNLEPNSKVFVDNALIDKNEVIMIENAEMVNTPRYA
mgnify:CR=1 FL=1